MQVQFLPGLQNSMIELVILTLAEHRADRSRALRESAAGKRVEVYDEYGKLNVRFGPCIDFTESINGQLPESG